MSVPHSRLPASSAASLSQQFRELHRLNLAVHGSYAALYADYLATGCRLLGMELGIVSRVQDGQYTVLAVQPADTGIAAGDVFSLDDTYCSLVLAAGRTIAVADVPSDRTVSAHPAYAGNPVRAYLAVPIRVGGSIYGTLNFTSTSGTAAFTEEDVELCELMALSLGRVIERDHIDQERARVEQELRANMELFESAFNYAAIGKALVGLDGRWLRVNRAVTEILGYSEGELQAIDFQSITHPEDLDADLEQVQALLAGEVESYRMEKRYFRKDGPIVWVLLSVSLVRSETGRPRLFVSQLQDVTERKRAESELARKTREIERVNAQLAELATIDALTRVFNRRAFAERLDAELACSARSGMALSLVLLDVDHFKTFNDEHGHLAGDEALRRVAQTLAEVGRINDVVARYGGEEFAVVLPGTDAAGCRVVAERMRDAITHITGISRPLTASFGSVTLEPSRSGREPHAARVLIRRADEALYAAKHAGRNCCRHAEPLS